MRETNTILGLIHEVCGVVKRHCKTGEPCALKGASTVRRGAVGNVITTVRMWTTRAGRLPDKIAI
jgi:hypothetical protein